MGESLGRASLPVGTFRPSFGSLRPPMGLLGHPPPFAPFRPFGPFGTFCTFLKDVSRNVGYKLACILITFCSLNIACYH